MGKNSKAQDAEMRRQYREAKLREEAEKQKRQNRLMWQIVFGVLAVILLIAAISLAISLGNKNEANNLEMGELEGFATSETATDYVRMFVTYTDKNGNLQSGNIVVQLRADVANHGCELSKAGGRGLL